MLFGSGWQKKKRAEKEKRSGAYTRHGFSEDNPYGGGGGGGGGAGKRGGKRGGGKRGGKDRRQFSR